MSETTTSSPQDRFRETVRKSCEEMMQPDQGIDRLVWFIGPLVAIGLSVSALLSDDTAIRQQLRGIFAFAHLIGLGFLANWQIKQSRDMAVRLLESLAFIPALVGFLLVRFAYNGSSVDIDDNPITTGAVLVAALTVGLIGMTLLIVARILRVHWVGVDSNG